MFTIVWQTGHELAWDVPRHSRTFLVQTVLVPEDSSMRASLLCRSVVFFHGLLNSQSKKVVVVALLAARDLQSSLGSKLALVREEGKLNPWTASRAELWAALEAGVKVLVPQQDSWRVPYLEKLLAMRLQAYYSGDKTGEEATGLDLLFSEELDL